MFDYKDGYDFEDEIIEMKEKEEKFNQMVEDLFKERIWKNKPIAFLDDNHFKNLMNFLKKKEKINDNQIDELIEMRRIQSTEFLENADEAIDHFNKVLKMAKYLPLKDKKKSIKSANYVIENLTELKRGFK